MKDHLTINTGVVTTGIIAFLNIYIYIYIYIKKVILYCNNITKFKFSFGQINEALVNQIKKKTSLRLLNSVYIVTVCLVESAF